MSGIHSMSHSHLVFHHLGLAVKKPQAASAFVLALGYHQGDTIHDPGQNVAARFCTHDSQPAIEILWPSESKGPIDAMVQKRPEGIIYHVCFATEDLAAALASLEESGNRVVCISPPMPAPLFGDRKVSFYNVVGIGLIEILS